MYHYCYYSEYFHSESFPFPSFHRFCVIPASFFVFCNFATRRCRIILYELHYKSNVVPFILLKVIDACGPQHSKVLLLSNSGHMLIIPKEKKKITWVLGKEARDNYMLNYQDPTTSKYYCSKLIANMGQGIILRAFRWYQRLWKDTRHRRHVLNGFWFCCLNPSMERPKPSASFPVNAVDRRKERLAGA